MKTYIKSVIASLIRRKNPVNWMNLRSTTPVSSIFGVERGLPIDRYYIEKFLNENSEWIKGDILEVGDDLYTRKYGINCSFSYILKYKKDDQFIFKKDDLTDINSLPLKKFDSIICTQTLHFIFDVKKALKGLKYLLKENGVLIITFPTISQVSVRDMELYGDYWRFTSKAVDTLLNNEFSGSDIKINCYGNILSCISFLEGISTQDLTSEELDYSDINHTLLICAIIKNRVSQVVNSDIP